MIKKLYCLAMTSPTFILGGLGAISIAALSAALISQFFFGLYPCELCLYQRIPYAVVILVSFMGLVTLSVGANKKYGAFNIALCAIAFLVNCAIAFYHVGVEQHWWVSGCSVPNFSNMTAEQIGESIRNAPVSRCDDIPWQMFGISMAGYNMVICAALGIYSAMISKKLFK